MMSLKQGDYNDGQIIHCIRILQMGNQSRPGKHWVEWDSVL